MGFGTRNQERTGGSLLLRSSRARKTWILAVPRCAMLQQLRQGEPKALERMAADLECLKSLARCMKSLALRCATLSHAVLCYAMLCYAMLCYAMLC